MDPADTQNVGRLGPVAGLPQAHSQGRPAGTGWGLSVVKRPIRSRSSSSFINNVVYDALMYNTRPADLNTFVDRAIEGDKYQRERRCRAGWSAAALQVLEATLLSGQRGLRVKAFDDLGVVH